MSQRLLFGREGVSDHVRQIGHIRRDSLDAGAGRDF
jgi:hypothetical protein